jgi:hypothetical protein
MLLSNVDAKIRADFSSSPLALHQKYLESSYPAFETTRILVGFAALDSVSETPGLLGDVLVTAWCTMGRSCASQYMLRLYHGPSKSVRYVDKIIIAPP